MTVPAHIKELGIIVLGISVGLFFLAAILEIGGG